MTMDFDDSPDLYTSKEDQGDYQTFLLWHCIAKYHGFNTKFILGDNDIETSNCIIQHKFYLQVRKKTRKSVSTILVWTGKERNFVNKPLLIIKYFCGSDIIAS